MDILDIPLHLLRQDSEATDWIFERMIQRFAEYRDTLASRERYIWDHRIYPIDYENPLSLKLLSQILCVSKQRIHQLESRITKNLYWFLTYQPQSYEGNCSIPRK